MSFDELPRRLTPMDAFFLYAERPEQPMHVGATCIFEGKFSFRDFMQHIGSRLHLIPRYQQRVMPAPLNIGHPTWETDPDFDLRNHIFRVELKGTRDDEELRELSGKVFTGLLDRNKPLWEVYYVEGLSHKRSALIFKVHHCMVDGVAGIGLAYVAFDMTPEPVKVKKQPFKAPPIPDPATRLYDALWDNAIGGIEHWARFQRSLANFGRGFENGDIGRAVRKFASTIGGFLMPFTKTSFNGPLGPQRLVDWLTVSFADARAVRAVTGGTVNDVILATLAVAIKRYMHERGEAKKTPRFVRILVPVNVRQEHERAALGNRISFMPVEVPLYFDDPIEILQAVHLNTRDLKDAKIPDAVGLMFEALQGMPAPVQAIALNSAANPIVQGVLSHVTAMPPANMICTNVPGPNIPLYVMGKRLTAMFPKVPVVMEMGINLALTSYDQKLFLCFCADGRSGKNVEQFRRCFEEAFAGLREAAEVKSADYVRITRGSRPDAAPTVPVAERPAAEPVTAKESPPRKAPSGRKKASSSLEAAPKKLPKKPAAKVSVKAAAKAKAKAKAATPVPAAKSVRKKRAAVFLSASERNGHAANEATHLADANGAASAASGTPRLRLK